MAFTTSVLFDDGVALVALDGELDLSVLDQVEHAVASVLEAGLRLVVLDLGALRFCDSSGLGALLQASRVTRDAGGTLLVAGAHGPVQRLFTLTSMERVLTIAPDVQSALVAQRRAATDAATGQP